MSPFHLIRGAIFGFLLVCMNPGNAQSNQTLRKLGSEAAFGKDWYAAEQYYQRLFMRDSFELNVMHEYAEAAREAYDIDVALRLYRKLASIDNGDRFPLTFYWIGQLLKTKEKYREAKKYFVKFQKQKLKKERYDYYRKKARIEEDACDFAIELSEQPAELKIEHLDQNINSRLSEYAATETDSMIYFASTRPEKKEDDIKEQPQFSKIYRAELRRGKLQRFRQLDTNFNAPGKHSGNVAIARDGKKMIFSRCTRTSKGEYQCALYVSPLIGKRWGSPEKVEASFNNESYSVTQPAFGEVGGKRVLFFSSNRPGGEGGMDIWYSELNEDETFAGPVNAGNKVNTPDDDVTPWYDFRKKRLYYSTTYHKGLGGFDIFYSVYKDESFTEPVNAGKPVNSSHNDLYYSISNLGHHAYLSSNRNGTMFDNNRMNCCGDIYRFSVDTSSPPPPPPPPKVDSVVVKKDQMKLLVPLTLYFHNDEPDPRTTNITTTRNFSGVCADYMKLRKTYVREYTRDLKGRASDVAENAINNFFSDSVQAGMENLDRFAVLLRDVLTKGETVKITMRGYCSPLASTDYNINLAKRRISSLKNYFREKDGGWFVKYIGNTTPGEGRIDFEEVQVGELPVSKASDDLSDKRNSVYSPNAAGERKIQIIAVSFLQ